MPAFLIDVNLPAKFKLWDTPEYIHQVHINDQWTDQQIWDYAKLEKLTIVTKDADFSSRVIVSVPPPKVIHMQIGNMKISEMFAFINRVWPAILELNATCKLVNVFRERLEGIN